VNTIDLIIGIILIFGTVRGFFKGFFIEATSLLGFLFGVYGSITFNAQASSLVTRFYSGNPDFIEIIAFALTFFAIVLVMNIIGKMLTKLANITALGLVNKLIGAAFGFLKSALVLCLFVLILLKINASYFIISEEKLQASQIYPVLENFSKALWNGLGNQKLFLPES